MSVNWYEFHVYVYQISTPTCMYAFNLTITHSCVCNDVWWWDDMRRFVCYIYWSVRNWIMLLSQSYRVSRNNIIFVKLQSENLTLYWMNVLKDTNENSFMCNQHTYITNYYSNKPWLTLKRTFYFKLFGSFWF